jgi:hypothetical protein
VKKDVPVDSALSNDHKNTNESKKVVIIPTPDAPNIAYPNLTWQKNVNDIEPYDFIKEFFADDTDSKKLTNLENFFNPDEEYFVDADVASKSVRVWSKQEKNKKVSIDIGKKELQLTGSGKLALKNLKNLILAAKGKKDAGGVIDAVRLLIEILAKCNKIVFDDQERTISIKDAHRENILYKLVAKMPIKEMLAKEDNSVVSSLEFIDRFAYAKLNEQLKKKEEEAKSQQRNIRIVIGDVKKKLNAVNGIFPTSRFDDEEEGEVNGYGELISKRSIFATSSVSTLDPDDNMPKPKKQPPKPKQCSIS